MFVSVIVTKGQEERYPAETLYAITYTALFFLNSEELFVSDPLFGYVGPEAFAKHLKHVL